MSATYLVLKESKEQNSSMRIDASTENHGEMYAYLVAVILLVSLYWKVVKKKESV